MEIMSILDSNSVDVNMSREELGIINNALNEVLRGSYAIDHVEFGTLMGVTRDEAKALLRQVHDLTERMRR
jgi:hypothetical protein